MLRLTFECFVRNLSNFYQVKRMPSPASMDMWFEQIRQMPDELCDSAQRHITSSHDAMPKNIPKLLGDLWQQYKQQNPGAARKGTPCAECGGSGLLMFGARGVRYVARCRGCENWLATFTRDCEEPAVYSRQELMRAGHSVEPARRGAAQ